MSTDVPSLSPEQKSLRKDFYLSYMHSQGDPMLQRNIFYHLSDYYQQTSPDIASALAYNDYRWLEFSHIPRGHIRTEDMPSDVPDMARSFLETVKGGTSGKTMTERTSILFNRIIKRDIKYQENDRTVGNDAHASYFRQHALLELPTGSEAYDDMYRAVGRLITDPLSPFRQSPTLQDLALKWTNSHWRTDEKFDPNGVLRP